MELSSRLARGEGRPKEILSDARLLREAGIPIIKEDRVTGVAFARITPEQEATLSEEAHRWGRCGGFEAVTPRHDSLREAFSNLRRFHKRNLIQQLTNFRLTQQVRANEAIEEAVSRVSEDNLRADVEWLSSFPTRYNQGPDANRHVIALKERLEKMVSKAGFPVRVDLIDHRSTPQKTLRVRFEGRTRPSEIVVLGGHLDSINQSWMGEKKAPGADDNASGSSNLIEALRILIAQPQPERSVEFFWYAGEESGLLGSAEIAKTYKVDNSDVVGVLQLDMTLHPGSGEFTLGSMTDFTSSWLRDYFKAINDVYIKAKIIEDECGYGCSDHASWHRQGFPAIMPFEATFRGANPRIHTAEDTINRESSFRHSAMFSRIAVAFAMDLSNSDLRQP